MTELIKYFESLEARIAQLEAQVAELQNRPLPEPQVIEKVVEKIVEVEKPVEVIKEVVVEKPVEEVAAPVVEPEPQPIKEEPVVAAPEPVVEAKEEQASPKAAMYGKAVDDIRQAISIGDRFLFQRELFSQDTELMQRTLTEINALASFDEAMNYIAKFGWDQESNSYQQFIVTLHRRFG